MTVPDRSANLVAGIVLAAGESRRMGRDKALLPIGNEIFLEHIVGALSGLVSPLVVVLGSHAGEIERAIRPRIVQPSTVRKRTEDRQENADEGPRDFTSDVVFLRNPDYLQGQITSLKVAIKHLLSTGASGAVVALVDHPAISPEVVAELIRRFEAGSAPILIPSYKYRRGHPVLFARSLFQELLDAPIDQGARSVVQRYEAEIEYVVVGDEGVLLDIDYPEDYQAYIARRTQTGNG